MGQITRYNRKISGPLIDRIDLVVHVNRVKPEKLIRHEGSESSREVATRIKKVRDLQRKRLTGTTRHTNAEMENQDIKKYCGLTPEANDLATQALSGLNLSARAYMRVMKVARTIADLDNSSGIQTHHLAEALQYRAKS
jgi:magnesium chelatase family protein